jgi:hypothetical protein
MAEVKAVCGDDVDLLVTLKKDGVAQPQNVNNTIQSVLVRSSKASDIVSSLSGDAGADWPAGIIAITFPGATTEKLEAGRYELHVAVTDQQTKRRTWITPDAVELSTNFIPLS